MRQKAGRSANQYQASRDLIVIQDGVTEQRAKEIADSAAQTAIAEYSSEAREIGLRRLARFDAELVGQLDNAGVLGALADPAFQVLLRKAQIGAASTERESDYDMLARLLTDRVVRAEDRRIRAGLDRAVEIVDKLDDPALRGLTAFWALMEFQPAMGDMDHGLDSYAQFLERLIDGELPSDAEWLDHLDVLDAVRVSVVGRLERSKEYFPKAMNGYTSPGVKRDSEDEVQGLAALKELGVDLPLVLVEHELRSGFRRIAVSADHHVVTVLKNAGCSSNVTRKAEAVAGKYFGLGQVHIELVPAFMAAMRQRPMLRDLMSWWDRIPYGVSLTVVGRVLARANAQRSRASALLSFGSG